MAGIVPLLHHLQPPGSIGPVRADRFSPYFETPEAFGIEVVPARPYAHLHDGPPEALADLAYHFDIVTDAPEAAAARAAPLIAAVRAWRDRRSRAELSVAGGRVTDSRGTESRTHRLSECEARLLDLCATICGEATLAGHIGREFGAEAFAPALARLQELGLVFVEGRSCLALPLRQPGFTAAPRWDEIRAAPEAAFAFACPDRFAPAPSREPAAAG